MPLLINMNTRFYYDNRKFNFEPKISGIDLNSSIMDDVE